MHPQVFTDLSPTSWYTTILPLTGVVTLSALRELIEDWKRHQDDRQVNNRQAIRAASHTDRICATVTATATTTTTATALCAGGWYDIPRQVRGGHRGHFGVRLRAEEAATRRLNEAMVVGGRECWAGRPGWAGSLVASAVR